MATIEQLENSDFFFYYGEGVLSELDEAQHDIYEQVMQPGRTYLYNRQEAAGLPDFENAVLSSLTEVLIKYLISSAIAYKNTLVTDGSNNTIDRRVAVSQNSIGVQVQGQEMDVSILFFRYADVEQQQTITIPIGSIN